jgi:hypothetical protein
MSGQTINAPIGKKTPLGSGQITQHGVAERMAIAMAFVAIWPPPTIIVHTCHPNEETDR